MDNEIGDQYPIETLPYEFVKKSARSTILADMVEIIERNGGITKSRILELMDDGRPADLINVLRERGMVFETKIIPGVETYWSLK